MNVITKIDKSGRIVVPKKLRDALHLVPETRLALHQQGKSLILRAESQHKGLSRKDGTLVYDAGVVAAGDIQEWIEKDREDRALLILGDLDSR